VSVLAYLTIAIFAAIVPQQQFSQHTAASEDGLTLTIRYYHPPAAGAPLVVVVHDWGGSLQNWEQISTKLQDYGFGVVLFNVRGHGGASTAYYYFSDERIAEMKKDVSLALAFARGRAGGAVHLLGAGLGANLAISVAAEEGGVDKVVAISPGLNYRGIGVGDAVQELEKGNLSLLMIASQEDVYSVYSIRELERSLEGRSQSRLLNNAGHGVWILMRQPASIEMIARWLARGSNP